MRLLNIFTFEAGSMPILWRLMFMDLVKSKTNSQLGQFVIILQNQGPSQEMPHMHHSLAVCWVRKFISSAVSIILIETNVAYKFS